MGYLYAAAAASTVAGALWAFVIRPLRRAWKWARARLERLDELPELARAVQSHDDALVTGGLMHRPALRPRHTS